MRLPGLFLVLLAAGCSPQVPPGVPVPPAEQKGDYVGMSRESAIAKARSQGASWRVIREDGESRPHTGDLQPERLNFTLDGGVVVGVTRG